MDNLAVALGVLAGLVQLAGYWQYNKLMSRIGHKPNVVSWFMWGAGGVTELIVYAALVQDGAKEILPAVCAVVAVVTFLRVWWRNGHLRLDRKDWTIVVFDFAVVAFWFITRNPFAANALLGIDMLLSFLPILLSVWKDPRSEHSTPWRTWTIAYGLLTLVVILRWENVWELIYPVLYLVLHALVWGIARFRANKAASL